MKVVHLSWTHKPYLRMCRALRRWTDVRARSIVLHPGQRFDYDVSFSDQREEALELLEEADILHLHNEYFSHFGDLDLSPFLARKKHLVQWHSSPFFLLRRYPHFLSRVLQQLSSVPQLVVAQFQERFYPHARVVPNVVDIPDAAPGTTEGPTTICYSPTTENTAFASRWSTKGFPETLAIIRDLVAKSDGVELDLIQNRPFSEGMARKARATIGIDEVVTGSYHRNSLEFLALGRPTLCHIDERVAEVLTRLTGCSELPWVQTTLGQLGDRLGELVGDLAATAELGERSHAWMKRYWHPSWAATCYERCYQDLLEGRTWSEPRFDLGNKKVWYSVIGGPDEKWRLRRDAWLGEEAPPPSEIGASSFDEWIAISGYWRSDLPMSSPLDGIPCRVAGLKQREIEDDGLLLLPPRDSGPRARLNRTARIIWEQCDGRTSVMTITESLAEMLDCGADQIAEDVRAAIQHLLEAKVVSLLDGPLPLPDGNPFLP